MKIVRMRISSLHGCYDYDIPFNKDITFLYGENGCGKTTVLSLLSSIISGELYKLKDYDFKTIEITYKNESNRKNHKIIVNKAAEETTITYREITKTVLYSEVNSRPRHLIEEEEEFVKSFFENNPICFEIKNDFDNMYIPLDRINIIDNATERQRFRRIFNYRRSNRGDYSPVEAMISMEYASANAELRMIDDNFRNQILKSSLEHNTKHIDLRKSINDFFTDDQTSFFEDVENSYINLMKELGLLSKDEEKNTRYYFKELGKQYDKYKKLTKKDKVDVELILKYQELKNLLSIKELSDQMSEEKNKNKEPFTRFISIINDFINEGGNDKSINIDEMGYIYLESEHGNRRIDLQNMSSGEKQLIVFYAYLIFSVSDKDAVFIVDEPELSLHLTWQRKFVDSALIANSKAQLIFATHSPEIVGKYENKMVKLVKHYTGV